MLIKMQSKEIIQTGFLSDIVIQLLVMKIL